MTPSAPSRLSRNEPSPNRVITCSVRPSRSPAPGYHRAIARATAMELSRSARLIAAHSRRYCSSLASASAYSSGVNRIGSGRLSSGTSSIWQNSGSRALVWVTATHPSSSASAGLNSGVGSARPAPPSRRSHVSNCRCVHLSDRPGSGRRAEGIGRFGDCRYGGMALRAGSWLRIEEDGRRDRCRALHRVVHRSYGPSPFPLLDTAPTTACAPGATTTRSMTIFCVVPLPQCRFKVST
jgi:hypothetical protein